MVDDIIYATTVSMHSKSTLPSNDREIHVSRDVYFTNMTRPYEDNSTSPNTNILTMFSRTSLHPYLEMIFIAGEDPRRAMAPVTHVVTTCDGFIELVIEFCRYSSLSYTTACRAFQQIG